jgi:hypothetical protein
MEQLLDLRKNLPARTGREFHHNTRVASPKGLTLVSGCDNQTRTEKTMIDRGKYGNIAQAARAIRAAAESAAPQVSARCLGFGI